jgi:FkbM family methyltransferase
LLYKRGWRGINIDPLPGSKEKFDRIRPRDLNLEVAVSSNVNPDGCMSYVQFEEPAYNYILPNENEIIEQENSKVIAIKNVPAKKLDDILEENCSQFDAIDLLNLDVESMEMDVLKSFSIDKYSPKVVVVEIRGLTIEEIQQSAIYHYLLRNHYRLQSVLYNSKIFTHVNE